MFGGAIVRLTRAFPKRDRRRLLRYGEKTDRLEWPRCSSCYLLVLRAGNGRACACKPG